MSRTMTPEELLAQFDEAIEKGYIFAYYQPQYNHATGRMTGAEALMRWQDPENGMQYPSVFIPVLEEKDILYRADIQMAESTCKLLRYCLDNDIPILAICRGMQMLSVVSGAEMIQDIPSYFEDLSIDYHYEHRNKLPSPGGYRNFSPHDVDLVKGSVISGIMGVDTVRKCPSWHHQAVMSVENTGLVVTGTTDTDGIPIIE